MKAHISKRIEIQRDLIDTIHNNIFLMHQLDNELKNTLLKENASIMRILFNSLAIAIIDLNKILKPSESYSFYKILNLIENNKELKSNKHFQTLKSDSIRLFDEFEKNNLKRLRDEHIVHSDLKRGEFVFSFNELFLIFTEVKNLHEDFRLHLGLRFLVLDDEYDSMLQITSSLKNIDQMRNLIESYKQRKKRNIRISVIDDILKQDSKEDQYLERRLNIYNYKELL